MTNCDMGKSFSLYKLGNGECIIPFIFAENVAYGSHGFDANHMHKTVFLEKRNGVAVGAHPSLPDLQGYACREIKITRKELANIIIYQVDALKGFLEADGMSSNHIKPHGDLYGIAARDETVAHTVCDAADVFCVPLTGLSGAQHEKFTLSEDTAFLPSVSPISNVTMTDD